MPPSARRAELALSFHNPEIQRLRRLLGRRSARSAEGVFVVEGAKLVADAVAAGAVVEAVYVEEQAWNLLTGTLPVRQVADGVIARVASTVTPQPVLAVVRCPHPDPGALRRASLVVACVEVADPGNMGTILRTATAAGAGAVALTESCADVWSPKVVRASAGAVLRIPVVAAPDPSALLDQLEAADLVPVAAVPRGGHRPEDVDLRRRVAIVVGNEAHGLDPAVEARVGERVTIPMASGAESLNVAMTAAVLCFEAARQRRT